MKADTAGNTGKLNTGKLNDLRQLVGRKAIRWGLEALAGAGRHFGSGRRLLASLRIERDLAYLSTGSEAHTLDLYFPPTPAPSAGWPVMLYVHGGGFRILSKDTHWLMGAKFARAGFLVVNINYRLAPANPYPAALEDVVEALGWCGREIKTWGGDLTKLVFAGESAGANLVTALAVALATEPQTLWAERAQATGLYPRAVVPACGILEVSNHGRLLGQPGIPRWVDDRIVDVCEGYLGGAGEGTLADPLVVLETLAKGDRGGSGRESGLMRALPEFFVPVGGRDVLVEDTRRLDVALRALGGRSTARYYEGEGHAFHALTWRPAAKACWRDMLAFVGTVAGETDDVEKRTGLG